MNQIQMPSVEICDRARASKDPRFDGLFYIAVRSTGIYCRPVCPAPTAKSANIVYYPTAAAAASAGYRPCLRCRPELSPEIRVHGNENAMHRALAMIADGALDDGSIEALASQVSLSTRQLRRLFLANAGATPLAVHATRRLLLAKQLLTETSLPVTQVALAAGFKSVRRFNAAFRESCGMSPSSMRRTPAKDQHINDGALTETLTLRLAFRPPLDFRKALEFLSNCAIPGVERITENSYERSIGPADHSGWIKVTSAENKPELRLEISATDPRSIPDIVRRVRRLFDLDADVNSALGVLQLNPLLTASIGNNPGLRIPGAWDGFEMMVRTLIGVQINNSSATFLIRSLVDRFGEQRKNAISKLDRIFPTPQQLVSASLESIGIPKSRAVSVRALAAAVLHGAIDFRAGQRLDEFVERATQLPGVGLWTAHYSAMRALNHPDAFPASDQMIRKNLGGVSESKAETLSQQWRPWRAYATLHLWNSVR
jgi:AraC family transcriptional regulator, regulatory protein of adaptative response / DNA-3-methyladenine glycosylase II